MNQSAKPLKLNSPRNYHELRNDVAQANFRHDGGGLLCARLFSLDPAFLAQVQENARSLVLENTLSLVNDKDHATNWAKPYGQAMQYSLLNRSGKLDDFTGDFDGSPIGKSADHIGAYPALQEFVRTWPGAINMRLNAMNPSSGLSPHEEHVVHPTRKGYRVLLRFHLPIVTNPKAMMFLDGRLFHFAVGNVFFYNNAAIHSAERRGDRQVPSRLGHVAHSGHLPADVRQQAAPWLTPVPRAEQQVAVDSERLEIDYATMGPGNRLHSLLRLNKVGLTPAQFQRAYNKMTYAGFRVGDRVLAAR